MVMIIVGVVNIIITMLTFQSCKNCFADCTLLCPLTVQVKLLLPMYILLFSGFAEMVQADM